MTQCTEMGIITQAYLKSLNERFYLFHDPINSNLLALSVRKSLTFSRVIQSPSGFITWDIITITAELWLAAIFIYSQVSIKQMVRLAFRKVFFLNVQYV